MLVKQCYYSALTKDMVGILNHCYFKWKTHIMVKLKKLNISKEVLIILTKTEDLKSKPTQI